MAVWQAEGHCFIVRHLCVRQAQMREGDCLRRHEREHFAAQAVIAICSIFRY